MTKIPTPEEQMKAIVEAAGECWHDWDKWRGGFCGKCDSLDQTNPSASSSTDLYWLSGKLGVGREQANKWIMFNIDDTPADALRKALCRAVKASV